MKTGTQLGYKF